MSSTVPSTMRASVLLAAQSLTMEERPVPRLDPDQVLVEVTSVGVCGSDVHFWHEGRLGDWVVDEPLVLGHESGGRIVAVGAAVDGSRVGERVSIEPQRPSPTSRETMSGRYNLDPAMRFYATPGVDGAFAQYVAIQSQFAWSIPDSVSDDAAALMEPLSVAVATAQKGSFTVGSRVLITGAGPIGILVAQVALAYGASEVIVSDVSEGRRSAALEFGATRVIDPVAEDIAALELNVDTFVDASGAAVAVRSGISAVRPGGTVVLVGMGASEIALPVTVIQNRELLVTGIFRYANTWPTAIELVRSGKVDLDSMVTGHFGLDDVDAALRSTTQPGTLKSVVNPQN
ncbi:MAG: L-iditol 2-dehydrogenase [Microbacteriaceae bacterium]|nr:L-iditol 2-dehydrogenase [Microbacteriaceae bacterium]